MPGLHSINHITIALQLKDQAVSLCDVVAPPDHILQSAIGSSDGQVRKCSNVLMCNNNKCMYLPPNRAIFKGST